MGNELNYDLDIFAIGAIGRRRISVEKYFTCSSLKELFKNVDATTIMDFIKGIEFLSSFVVFVLSFPIYISYQSFIFT